MRIVWNNGALREIRSDPAVVGMEEAEAQRRCDELNARGKGTYITGSRQGVARPQGRWRTTVATGDARAMVDNAKYNTLVRSL